MTIEQTSIRLPVELFLQIIPYLYNHTSPREEWDFSYPSETRGRISPSLLACSLVCHTWNDICRPLIFRSIHVDCNESVARSSLDFLHFTAPHLCKDILGLHLDLSTETTEVPQWIDVCLGRFTKLRELELRYWSDVESISRASLLRGITSMLAGASLKRLALVDWARSANNPKDLLLILSACSATLEYLMIDSLPRGSSHTTPIVPSVVRMEALRRIELYKFPTPFTRSITIECPNLETFAISCNEQVPWELPSWIPERIPKLELQSTYRYTLLQFRWPIYPSSLTIQLMPFGITWPPDDFLALLPFFDCLRHLTIKVFSSVRALQPPFPESTHYDALCHLLQSLQRPTLLKRIIITVENRAPTPLEGDELEGIRVRENARLEKAFAPFLKSGTLSVQVVLLHWGESGREVLVRCGT
ncbi:hypothetical protein PC9H_007978 [Pleurotus ostreatus]|uniref:F-box domain-containing protein n=1 Tax=Pleurotus ostreatus TaxID=5322 RepID=A0A8H7DQP2_PLEOS|nr:uncharacterized protein PC9H_007978 [Pleurotus ostreatus]KAF7428746.1 hypothetical protein PC9H_007978 [Pleurotus ostreatus]KAJ8696948.1 hypothetical protein PTI98_006770 [Pleurotus ostreatus]